MNAAWKQRLGSGLAMTAWMIACPAWAADDKSTV